jgi:predicted ATPase with chaperone activity
MTRTLNEILTPRCEEADINVSDQFFPEIPETLEESGLNQSFIEDLICKMLLSLGSLTGRELSQRLGLPLQIFGDLLYGLKQRLLLAYQSTSGVNDFHYILTETGKEKALLAREYSNYLGTAPVPFTEYLTSIERQSIRNERPGLEQLKSAFDGLVLSDDFLDLLGPAVNSGRGMFLYGEPGNGKTEIATRIARCFTDSVYIPRTIIVEGQLIQLYDPQCHNRVEPVSENGQKKSDQRWLQIERPAVVVGGEMDLDSLEIGYNAQTKICEASLQLKGNSGVFAIDDFGRQRVGPEKMLNRWILPLEKRVDYLTLPSGNKIMVPFNALLVFCSNLDPGLILDEAFLRRIPYKIRMQDPTAEEFISIFQDVARQFEIPYDQDSVDYLIEKHFRSVRPMRGCHPRDILQQLANIALYENRPPRMTKADLDRSIGLYFLLTGGEVKPEGMRMTGRVPVQVMPGTGS